MSHLDFDESTTRMIGPGSPVALTFWHKTVVQDRVKSLLVGDSVWGPVSDVVMDEPIRLQFVDDARSYRRWRQFNAARP